MRIMWIITVVWITAIVSAFVSGRVMTELPAGESGANLAAALLALNFVAWCVSVGGLPAVVIGWPAVIIAGVLHKKQPRPGRVYPIPKEPGFYRLDRESGKYRRLPPPC